MSVKTKVRGGLVAQQLHRPLRVEHRAQALEGLLCHLYSVRAPSASPWRS